MSTLNVAKAAHADVPGFRPCRVESVPYECGSSGCLGGGDEVVGFVDWMVMGCAGYGRLE
jgi:hypothetical protein